MIVEVNTDNHIDGHERLHAYLTSTMESALKRFEDKITRIEVFLGDENSSKGGSNDKRCSIEARVAGLKPIGVVHHADTIENAIKGATDRIKHALEHTFGKLQSY